MSIIRGMNATQSARCTNAGALDVAVRKDTLDEARVFALDAMLRSLARRFEAKPTSCTAFQQETLVALWLLCGARAKVRVSLQTWLYSVAEGVPIRPLSHGLGMALRGEPRDGADGDASELAFAIRARVTLLLALLDSFSPREREVALLDLQLLEPERSAEKLHCSSSQVRQLLVLAQRRLNLWILQRHIFVESLQSV